MYIPEISVHAAANPDKAAIIMADTGVTTTFGELDRATNRFAHALRSMGLSRGDGVVIVMENNSRYLEICAAAARSGLYFTSVNRYLTPDEAAYIINDCGAKVLIASKALAKTAQMVLPLLRDVPLRLMVDGVVDGFASYEAAVSIHPETPISDQQRGMMMLYSSGTTGQPKGIRRAIPNPEDEERTRAMEALSGKVLNWHPGMVYLSPAPMYHAAPLGTCLGVLDAGGTVVVMHRFDEEDALSLIETHRITHATFVPTMFVRMLKLPQAIRHRFDMSSLTNVAHSAAPCPPEVKRQMIDWWGPLFTEYYGSTEAAGMTTATSAEWLKKPGTVGTAKLGKLRICDDNGVEVPPNVPGKIYFERDFQVFEYWKDPEGTKNACHPQKPFWTTVGDIGYVDDDGYLFLTDRATFMIISGGVNIYPQAIENCLTMHPKVADVAVFGVPNEDMGEEVKAVVQLMPGQIGSEAVGEELKEYARAHIAPYMVPRSVDFTDELPRLPTGKLYKRLLRDAYWEAAGKLHISA